MADVMDKKKQQGTPEKDAEAEKELTILQPGAVPEEDEDPEAPYLASDMYQRIVALINNFESGLPDDMQAGGAWYRLAISPSASRISATGIRT